MNIWSNDIDNITILWSYSDKYLVINYGSIVSRSVHLLMNWYLSVTQVNCVAWVKAPCERRFLMESLWTVWMFASLASSGAYRKRLWKGPMARSSSNCVFVIRLKSWPPFDHYCAVAPQNAEKACCDNQQGAFSCFGLYCAEPTKFTFQRRSIPSCRSSPTTATSQV